jgi:amino acid adenylation domain-containing protein
MTATERPLTVSALAALHGDVQVLPVSFAQQRFYMLDQLEELGAAAYTIPIALRLRGVLDAGLLVRAINAIVARHESLRTLFVLEGDEPVQVVLPTLHIPLSCEDLRALDDETRASTMRARATENANATFELAAGPLLRASLVQLGEDEHVLLLALHHIIADGWSVGLMFDELEKTYSALLRGEEPALPALALQYPDFAVWQRRAMQGAATQKQIAYWAERLRDLPTLELPTDRARPAVQSLAGGKRETMIIAPVVEAIRAIGRRESATPYMVFLAAFSALMHRYSSQTDLVIGSITSGRQRPEVAPLIGLFVNTLAIRVDASGEPTFVELLSRVRERASEAYANQDVPFEHVVDAVQPPRDRSRSPIFQVAFQLLEGLGRDLTLPGITVSRIAGIKDTTKFDLTLMLHAAPGGSLRAVMEYNSTLFDPETVDRMLTHFATILAGIARAPSARISELPLMPEAERTRILNEWNATDAPVPDASLHALIFEQARRTPNAVAVESDATDDDVERLTFGELAERATQLASHLRRLGVGPGVGVGVCIDRSCDLVVALLGVLAAGGHYVPLDPAYPADRVAYMLAQSRVPVLLTHAALAERLPLAATASRVIALDAEWSAIASGERDAAVPAESAAEDLAYVIYTSGSTGRPKGVMIPHRAVVNYVHWMRTAYPVDGRDAILQKAPASFDACIWEFFLPLVTGARLVLARPSGHQDPIYLADVVRRRGVTVLQLVPSQLQMMLETPEFLQCGTLRHVVCGGEALPGELLGRLATVMPDVAVTNLYGPTETTVYSTHWTLERTRFDGSAPIGRPIFNTQVYVLDPAQQPTPIGVPGELCIAGRGVARGYLGQAELTAEKFVPDAIRRSGTMYRTGDRARWRADGTLEYFGRSDHQVKLRGFRIELGEIESVIATHPQVQSVAALVREDTPGDKRLVAYVVATPEARPTPTELRARVQASLPEFMVPSAVVFLDVLPLNANGKLDRRALPALDGATTDDTPFIAPRSPLELQIAGVWAAVLGRDRVGVNDDFFALGGHSLLAMRVVARLADTLPVRLTIGALFQARTVAGLAAIVEQRIADQNAAPSDDEMAALLDELDMMSDAEAARLTQVNTIAELSE